MQVIRAETKFFFSVVSVSLLLCIQQVHASPCESLAPFLAQSLGLGVDIASLDLQPRLSDLQNGYSVFKEQVVHLTCNREESVRLNDGRDYQLPDQVLRLYDHHGQDYTRHGIGAKDESDYLRKMAQSFGLALSEGVFRSSPGYRRIKRSHAMQTRIRDRVHYVQLQRNLLLRDEFSLQLAPEAMVEFGRLPEEYADAPRAYEDFIERFGTHYLHKIFYGDMARIEFERLPNDTGPAMFGDEYHTVNEPLTTIGWFSELGKELVYNCSSIRSLGSIGEDSALVLEHDRLWRLFQTEELRLRVFTVYGGRLRECHSKNVRSSANKMNNREGEHLQNEGQRRFDIVSRGGWSARNRLGGWEEQSLRELMSTWQDRDLWLWPLYGKVTSLDKLLPDGLRKESYKKAVKLHLEAAELEDGN